MDPGWPHGPHGPPVRLPLALVQIVFSILMGIAFWSVIDPVLLFSSSLARDQRFKEFAFVNSWSLGPTFMDIGQLFVV